MHISWVFVKLKEETESRKENGRDFAGRNVSPIIDNKTNCPEGVLVFFG